VLDVGPDPRGKGQFLGKGSPTVKYRDTLWSVVTYAKTDEPIVMPFGFSARSGSRNYELDGVQVPHEKGQFWGKGSPIVKYRDFLP